MERRKLVTVPPNPIRTPKHGGDTPGSWRFLPVEDKRARPWLERSNLDRTVASGLSAEACGRRINLVGRRESINPHNELARQGGIPFILIGSFCSRLPIREDSTAFLANGAVVATSTPRRRTAGRQSGAARRWPRRAGSSSRGRTPGRARRGPPPARTVLLGENGWAPSSASRSALIAERRGWRDSSGTPGLAVTYSRHGRGTAELVVPGPHPCHQRQGEEKKSARSLTATSPNTPGRQDLTPNSTRAGPRPSLFGACSRRAEEKDAQP